MDTASDRPAVIVVEDDAMNRRLFREVLQINGFSAVCTPDGEDIERLVQQTSAVLVLMDIQLPRESGVDLMRRLRAHPATRDLPIHAVTAFAETLTPDVISDRGFNSVIPKPVHLPTLINTVQGAVV